MGTLQFTAVSVLFALGPSQHPASGATLCIDAHDPAGEVLAGANVEIRRNDLRRQQKTDSSGSACFREIEAGTYEVQTESPGLQSGHEEAQLVAGELQHLLVVLKLESVVQQVTVAAGEADPSSLNVAQTELSAELIEKLPSESVNAGLSSVLTLATPGVAADSNGVFHPLGEHAETSFNIDGQPISDQQSRIFSNQVSMSTIQDMRTIQGAPPAEFGDKTSLIVEANTRSGLNSGGPSGNFSVGYGAFQTPTVSFTLGTGSKRLGNFLAVDAIDSNRFLDTPEFAPLHASGNAENFFDRSDWRPNDSTAVHLNLSAAHSWFQVPNTYDQQSAGQDQRQQMLSFNAALGGSLIVRSDTIVTANVWLRQDRVEYFPSANLFADQPATLAQSRRLTSTGGKADLSLSRSRHTVKAGVQVQITPLSETFSTGLTDPAFNSPCVDATGVSVGETMLTDTTQCSAAGYFANASFQPALLQFDLTRGGRLFEFHGATTISEESAYVQDDLQFCRLNLNLGVRYDNYNGLTQGSGIQPRMGASYRIRSTGTVLHGSYARVFLTPYNENLILSSSTGPGGLANGALGAAIVQPLTPARRNQFNTGIEQDFGKRFSVEAEYFWKYTRGAYDFNTILNTPLNFPIQFRESKIDGALIRATLKNFHGLSAFSVLGHSRSRLFSPEIGGINFGTSYAPVARPDHDQNFEQTTNVQYQMPSKTLRGLWIGLTWRFDSGLVVVSVPDYATALTLTGDEQQEIGLFCGNIAASISAPLRVCDAARQGASRIHIVPPGTYDPDRNPSRITPRHLFDLALGSDSLWKKDRYAIGAKMTIVNLADKAALYNFLSSFSGTHFVPPRTLHAEMTLRF